MSNGAGHRRLQRRRDGRLIAGVAAGLASHVGLDVVVVRVLFVVTGVLGGAGVLAYAAFWLLLPLSDDEAPAPRKADWAQLIAFVALSVGALLIVQVIGLPAGLLWPATAAAVGVALVWRQADDGRRSRWRTASARLPRWATSTRRRDQAVRLVIGLVLVVSGLAGVLHDQGALPNARRALLPIVVVVVGLALITGPWWLRTVRELGAERRARIHEQERAEIAAHIHDAVLQTLTLIQRRADDPREVLRLARSSEREVRRWLYRADEAGGSSLRTAVEAAAAEAEDDHGVPIDVVAVGDADLDERTTTLVQAAREAMVNAAKSSGAAVVSVFVEVDEHTATVFVRDRGRGFDPSAVADDRFGIRESIVGRMQRGGGSADIWSTVGVGTEVHLVMPLRAAARAHG